MLRTMFAVFVAIMVCIAGYEANAKTPTPPVGLVRLSTFLENLRQEFIVLAKSGGKDKLPLFVSPIKIELTTTARISVDGKLELYVVTFGTDLNVQATQKMVFTVGIGDKNAPLVTMRPNKSWPDSLGLPLAVVPKQSGTGRGG